MNNIKIKNINIQGIRGVKETLTIPLEEKSIIIYGDNGTGKSSISDSLEWYFKDEVRPLSSMEIDLKEALRNTNLLDIENSLVNISLSKEPLNSQKSLVLKKGKIVAEHQNESPDFKNYLIATGKENILLRYQYLTEFIEKTKGDKLKSLSDVIGFSEVNKTKDVLRKVFSSLKTEIKNQNFENQINTQKEILKEKIGAVVSVEQNLIEKITEIIKPLKLNVELKSINDIDVLLNKLKVPLSNPLLNELKFLENIKNSLTTLKNESGLMDIEYSKYYLEFNSIANDVQGIMQTFLAEMLKAGQTVLEKKYHKDDSCPLCLQPKKKDDLLLDIKKRLKEIEESSKKKASYDNAKQTIIKISSERIQRLEFLSNESLINEPTNSNIKRGLNSLSDKFNTYLLSGNEKVTSGNKIKDPKELLITDSNFAFLDEITNRIADVKKTLEKDSTTAIYSNISAAKDAFIRIKKFEAERLKLERQKNSLEIIFTEFVGKQKEALENFINNFSGTINEYYQYMNPGEQFDEIKIVTMGEEDELAGITIEYKYNNNWVSPPQKYFSESHLNCFGLSFFLASVKAFNKENKFIILDDIISSFDANHRKRFADLLLEKFSDFQIILLTHEVNWFEYVRNAVKSKNWLIKTIKWTDIKGSHFDEKPENLKAKIELKISNNDSDKLGNEIREYLEGTLKLIANNLEVKLKFQFNEKNEDRMAFELLTETKSRISKSTAFSTHNALFDRALNSIFIGNKDSHDSKYIPSMGDFKAFWKDVQDIENLFFCDNCNTPVHLKYYDEANKNIKCKCGSKLYDLKK
jgi:energy-coupling factor transporter ATP-binding protein EcfA2